MHTGLRRRWLQPHAVLALVWLATSAVVADTPGALQPPAPDLSTGALLDAARRYVRDYQAAFAFLVADETYIQETSVDGRPAGRRTIRGELFLTYLETDRDWVAVHDVAEVDGGPVGDRDDLRQLLQEGSVRSVAARVFARNARFNIGRVDRNFNEPTFALLVVSDKWSRRFKFSREAVMRDATGTTLATLAFREQNRPTIVKSPRGSPLPSKGEVTLDAATGRVHRTRIEFRDGGLRAELTTTYIAEPRLDLWVPSVFTERYELGQSRRVEVTICEARYDRYRRFETSARVR